MGGKKSSDQEMRAEVEEPRAEEVDDGVYVICIGEVEDVEVALINNERSSKKETEMVAEMVIVPRKLRDVK